MTALPVVVAAHWIAVDSSFPAPITLLVPAPKLIYYPEVFDIKPPPNFTGCAIYQHNELPSSLNIHQE